MPNSLPTFQDQITQPPRVCTDRRPCSCANSVPRAATRPACAKRSRRVPPRAAECGLVRLAPHLCGPRKHAHARRRTVVGTARDHSVALLRPFGVSCPALHLGTHRPCRGLRPHRPQSPEIARRPTNRGNRKFRSHPVKWRIDASTEVVGRRSGQRLGCHSVAIERNPCRPSGTTRACLTHLESSPFRHPNSFSRAASAIATMAGCFSRRSTETA